jgi:hypothetical protein
MAASLPEQWGLHPLERLAVSCCVAASQQHNMTPPEVGAAPQAHGATAHCRVPGYSGGVRGDTVPSCSPWYTGRTCTQVRARPSSSWWDGGGVREPGSLTLPHIAPAEGMLGGVWNGRRSRPFQTPQAEGERGDATPSRSPWYTGRTCTQVRANLFYSGGFSGSFGVAEKTTKPTPKGSVREPGSRTHPQVPPAEGSSAGGTLPYAST